MKIYIHNKDNKYDVRPLRCCYGISSKANNNDSHVLMFDFDHVDIKNVIDYLIDLQKRLHLSNIYVISSNNGFNAICLDIFPLNCIYEIGTDIVSPCDRLFYKAGKNRGYFTLRFSDDKKLFCILMSNNKVYNKSFVHKCFLEWFFDIKIDCDNCFNDYTRLRVIQYPSDKDGFHLVDKKIPSYFENIAGV